MKFLILNLLKHALTKLAFANDQWKLIPSFVLEPFSYDVEVLYGQSFWY